MRAYNKINLCVQDQWLILEQPMVQERDQSIWIMLGAEELNNV